MSYPNKLRESAEDCRSIACFGVDPVKEELPGERSSRTIWDAVFMLEDIYDEMERLNIFPSAFKPNEGFYSVYDEPMEDEYLGRITLSEVVANWKRKPKAPIIMDVKRGDIGKSSANYAKEFFEQWGADAVTVHGYMGWDSVEPFAQYCKDGHGVYVLVRTSNPGASDFQSLQVNYNGDTMPLYMAVAHKVATWAADHPGIGAVVGATAPEELTDIAELFVKSGVEIPLLIPGVGSQGGSAREVVDRLAEVGYPLELARINSSSGLLQPWMKRKQPAPNDYAKVCVDELAKLNEEIGYRPESL